MGQVTLYLDSETEIKMKEAAKAAGVSQSRWLAELVRQKTESEWPPAIKSLAGSWADLPTAEELREGMPEDLPREPI